MSKNEELIQVAKRVLLQNYRPAPVVLSEGKGSRVRDVDGREYLDLAAGLAVCSVGHGHPALARAIGEQAGKLMHVSNLFWNDRGIELARRLTERTGYDRVFFCNSGTEANEAMFKLARYHHFRSGDAKRVGVISTIASFHGRTLGSLTLTGQPKYHEGMGPLVGGVTHVPYGDLEAMKKVVDHTTAAIIVEPVQAEGGIFVPPVGYLAGLRELCDQRGALLLFDEVQTGVGRTGTYLAAEQWGVHADASTLAKGIAGGFPLGAMLVRERFADALPPGTHASTFGGNPLASAAALAVLDIFEQERVLPNVSARGEELAVALLEITKAFPKVATGTRGMGLLQGIVLGAGVDPANTLTVLRAQGALGTIAGGNVLRLCPALTITRDELHQGLDAVRKTFALLAEKVP
ncbi:MAG TPA: acetylornithine/succinylornithine family transaminase [Polyangiales bacterium]|nr:acetylornithine/succinylornithine family transaminase [Polyangiales bacterium]